MPKSPKPPSYQQLSDQLAGLIEWFESDQVNLDEAVSNYQKAMELLNQRETYLKTAKNQVKKISAKFDDQ